MLISRLETLALVAAFRVEAIHGELLSLLSLVGCHEVGALRWKWMATGCNESHMLNGDGILGRLKFQMSKFIDLRVFTWA